ncbi:SDR family oxidoreductase [Lacisediminimonas profundi]|uniref:SDR family oxidoreductase n=1 Tax=Lacisediminimonas profundi TaxID=2603856 RepID=UPI00124B46CA|nr:SDR family oxidoreductase [Lacisediminimonas profundi]
MDLGLKGKIALVTASSNGIGKQCALALAAEGARIVMCARNAERLEAAAQEVTQLAGEGNVLAVQADLSSAADIDRLCNAANERFGQVDILVFIGGSPKRGGFAEVSDADLLEAFDVTVLAGFRLTRKLVPGMRQRKWGRVVTVQARSVREPIPDLVTSVATRPGVAGLFKYLANEAGQDGVLVNVIVPGPINTDRFKKGAEEAKGGADDYVRMKVGGIPVGRLGEAHEIASAVCFLVSEQASYINGVALQVDGGVIKAI